MTGPANGTVPVGPMLSMYDPIHVGSDEFGQPFYIRLIYKNLLAAGEPGGGKSGLLNTVAAHAALSTDSRLVLFDAKDVELGMWDQTADEFVGPDIGRAIITLLRLQKVMENRYAWLRAHRRRKIEPADGLSVITSIFDEIAVFSTVLGSEHEQRQFLSLLRDLVARGRAAAMPVVAATQRPSVDIIPKSLRDLFGYRAACRCTSTGSSDIILGDGWSGAGFSATDISPVNPGEALLIAEGGIPQRIKAAYLSDVDIRALADYAAWTRRTHRLTTHRRPGYRRRLTHPSRKGTSRCSTPPTPRPGRHSPGRCASSPTTSTGTAPCPSPPTARPSSCTPTPPKTADAPRSTTSPGSWTPRSATRPPPAATTAPPAPSASSATRSTAIPRLAMATHRALWSYRGSVTPGPDTWT